jgi:ABC-type methionine transport system ATPase subunit
MKSLVISVREEAYDKHEVCYTILLPVTASICKAGVIMVKRRMMFVFPQEQLKEPIIYNLSHQFHIVTNILQADITDDKGWMILEIEGESDEISQGIDWVTTRGVRVEPVNGEATKE